MFRESLELLSRLLPLLDAGVELARALIFKL